MSEVNFSKSVPGRLKTIEDDIQEIWEKTYLNYDGEEGMIALPDGCRWYTESDHKRLAFATKKTYSEELEVTITESLSYEVHLQNTDLVDITMNAIWFYLGDKPFVRDRDFTIEFAEDYSYFTLTVTNTTDFEALSVDNQTFRLYMFYSAQTDFSDRDWYIPDDGIKKKYFYIGKQKYQNPEQVIYAQGQPFINKSNENSTFVTEQLNTVQYLNFPKGFGLIMWTSTNTNYNDTFVPSTYFSQTHEYTTPDRSENLDPTFKIYGSMAWCDTIQLKVDFDRIQNNLAYYKHTLVASYNDDYVSYVNPAKSYYNFPRNSQTANRAISDISKHKLTLIYTSIYSREDMEAWLLNATSVTHVGCGSVICNLCSDLCLNTSYGVSQIKSQYKTTDTPPNNYLNYVIADELIEKFPYGGILGYCECWFYANDNIYYKDESGGNAYGYVTMFVPFASQKEQELAVGIIQEET